MLAVQFIPRRDQPMNLFTSVNTRNIPADLGVTAQVG